MKRHWPGGRGLRGRHQRVDAVRRLDPLKQLHALGHRFPYQRVLGRGCGAGDDQRTFPIDAELHCEFIGSGECDRLLSLVEPDIDVTGFDIRR